MQAEPKFTSWSMTVGGALLLGPSSPSFLLAEVMCISTVKPPLEGFKALHAIIEGTIKLHILSIEAHPIPPIFTISTEAPPLSPFSSVQGPVFSHRPSSTLDKNDAIAHAPRIGYSTALAMYKTIHTGRVLRCDTSTHLEGSAYRSPAPVSYRDRGSLTPVAYSRIPSLK